MEYLYRAKEHTRALGGIAVHGDWEFSGFYETEIQVHKYEIIKRTPKGVWIYCLFDKKFVNLIARKKFATVTLREAYEQLYARKRSQVKILKTNLDNAQKAFDMAKTWLEKDNG